MSKGESVKVIVRCRPLNEKEKRDGHEMVVQMNVSKGEIQLTNPKVDINSFEAKRSFTFDAIYDWNSRQLDLYTETFKGLVDAVLEGFNGTIFAYGQTGTGKTFTMEGIRNIPEQRGVIPHSFDHIFTNIERSENQQYLVRASYLEIYQEEIRDLLAKDQSKHCELKERPDTGVYVKDLLSFVTKGVKEIEHVMTVGNKNRSIGSTNMNEHSSRSHAIFIITVECSDVGLDGENHIRVGKLNLVDLAGSERQAKTGATGERLKEATKINLSLSALGNVISSLVDGKSSHIPYRDSKLTRLLQDSLGGNAKTVMVANIGPASYNFDESLGTLRYANRAKNIKNKPKINEDPKDALLREFQEEIMKLKGQIKSEGGGKKRRTRKGHSGKGGRQDGSDSGEDDDGEDEDQYVKKEQNALENEKKTIMNDQNMIADEKSKLLHDLETKQSLLKQNQEEKSLLQKKLKSMESKLLMGGKTIVDRTQEQQQALEQRKSELAEQRKREHEIEQKLQEKEERALGMKETYATLKEEVDAKTKKLKKIFSKLQSVKGKIEEKKEEYSQERQELEQTLNELNRHLKLKILIIDNFIPSEENSKLSDRAVYDEEADSWTLQRLTRKEGPMAKRPLSALDHKRPISEYSRRAMRIGDNPRFKGENILSLELERPYRTTRDYEGPQIAPRVQAVLDAALQDEDDMEVELEVSAARRRPKTASHSDRDVKRYVPPSNAVPGGTRNRSQMFFPSSKGLVPK